MKNFTCIAILSLFVSVVYAQQSTIDLVKKGVLISYPSVTAGKALESTFSNPKWSTQTARNGAEQVIFTGKIKKGTFEDYYGTDRATMKEQPNDINLSLMFLGLNPDEVWEEILKVGGDVSVTFNISANRSGFGIGTYTCDSCPKDMNFIEFVFGN